MSEKTWRDNHMFTSLAMMVLIGSGLTAIGTVTGMYDAGHTTQAELEAVVVPQMCRSLKIQIQLAESAIWQMEQAGDTSRRLVDLRADLRDYLATYRENKCASVLAQ